MSATILQGDCREVLRTLAADSFQCVVTSPPYWGLRDYGLPPSIWEPPYLDGCPEPCAHEWGEELRRHKGGPHGETSSVLQGGRAIVGAQAATKDVRSGSFCEGCGAWRGCLGLEPTWDLYVWHMVQVFREVHRVLRPDGVLWLNLGDCYATGAGSSSPARGDGRPEANGHGKATRRKAPRSGYEGKHGYMERKSATNTVDPKARHGIGPLTQPNRMPQPGLKPKDLVGIPWRVAFALQADGWWLRMDNIWHKPNPMPESVEDRTTRAHEYVFHLTKSERYFYDRLAIVEPFADERQGRDGGTAESERNRGGRQDGYTKPNGIDPSANGGRNKRSVWTITTRPYEEAHFATFPETLIEPCILAGSSTGGACSECGSPWVRQVRELEKPDEWLPICEHRGPARNSRILDPFSGSGTVAMVGMRHHRECTGIELNPSYCEMSRRRITDDAPLLNHARVTVK